MKILSSNKFHEAFLSPIALDNSFAEAFSIREIRKTLHEMDYESSMMLDSEILAFLPKYSSLAEFVSKFVDNGAKDVNS